VLREVAFLGTTGYRRPLNPYDRNFRMPMRCCQTLSLLAVATLALGCQSTAPTAPCKTTQAIVDSVAADYPAVVRLTVHTTMPGGSGPVAVASTWAEKLGKPSDPEDLDAMRRGMPVVLETLTEVDVTLPILNQGARWDGAVGVSFKNEPERAQSLQALTDLAKAIAKVVEDRMIAAR